MSSESSSDPAVVAPVVPPSETAAPARALGPNPIFGTDSCGVCLVEYSNRGVAEVGWLSCGHVFHLECVRRWAQISNTCPLCKLRFAGIVRSTLKAVLRAAVEGKAPRGKEVVVEDRSFRYVADVSEFVIDDSDVPCVDACLLRSGYAGPIDADDFCVQCDDCSSWHHGVCAGFATEAVVPPEWQCARCAPAHAVSAEVMLRAAGVPERIAVKGVAAANRWAYMSVSSASTVPFAAGENGGGAPPDGTLDRISENPESGAGGGADSLVPQEAIHNETLARSRWARPSAFAVEDIDQDDHDGQSVIDDEGGGGGGDFGLFLRAASGDARVGYAKRDHATPPPHAFSVRGVGGGAGAADEAEVSQRTVGGGGGNVKPRSGVGDGASAGVYGASSRRGGSRGLRPVGANRRLRLFDGSIMRDDAAGGGASAGGAAVVAPSFVAEHWERSGEYCHVCVGGDSLDGNVILLCDGCDVAVHQACYGVPVIPDGEWFCRPCEAAAGGVGASGAAAVARARAAPRVQCIFCPCVGGAYKPTTDRRWAHSFCTMWVPEAQFVDPVALEPVGSVSARGVRVRPHHPPPLFRWNQRLTPISPLFLAPLFLQI